MRNRRLTGQFAVEDAATRIRNRSQRQGDCIVYTSGKPRRSGHRAMSFNGKLIGVHRIAWILVHGEIPDGLCVLHRCDVGSCVNVDHLFLGTVAQNNADRDRKGRHARVRGSRHNQAKLSEYQIIEIRRLLKNGVTQRSIAAQYGVTPAAISRIARGETWRHVQEAA